MKRGWIPLLILINLSCETIVDVDLKEPEPQIVVNSFFSPDSVWQVRVTKSRFILSSREDFDVEAKAAITIKDSKNTIIEKLLFDGFFYKGKSKPEVGKEYTISVEDLGKSKISAKSEIPLATPIISVKTSPLANNSVQISVLFLDNVNQKNYYLLKVINDNGYDLFVDAIDPIYNNNNRSTPGILFNDNLFNGKTIDFRVSADSPPIKRIILVSVSEEYYQYFTTKQLQENTQGDPFAQPTQIFTNIENGLGIFAGYNSFEVIL